MMARRSILGALAGGAFSTLLGGCKFLGNNSYRFRLTVEVKTPQGDRTGSSVYEVTAGNRLAITREMADRSWSVRGEAVAVDIVPGETLFALLKTGAHFGDMAGLSMSTLYPAFAREGYDLVAVAGELGRRGTGAAVPIAPSDYPLLVTFTDIADPKSVVRVDPANLAASFGHGVALKRIVVELTDDLVTMGIEKRLKWLQDHHGSLEYTGRLNHAHPEKDLTSAAFYNGIKL